MSCLQRPSLFQDQKKLLKTPIFSSRTCFFKVYFIDYAITAFPIFPPLPPLHLTHPLPSTFPPFSSCPWVLHINSLASTFPILFNLPLLIFYLPFMLLIFCTFSPSLPSHSPTDNPPCDLHFYDSVPVLVVCLVFFCFCFRCGC